MSISKYPSKLTLPNSRTNFATVYDYLVDKFPRISASVWQQRMLSGKVHQLDGSPLNLQSAYQPGLCLCYYREVEQEAIIPFSETIVFEDDELLLAYKPHFLPVTPGGRYVNECLQNRLRDRTGLHELQAVHRLDRVTAGLVLFAKHASNRHSYHQLFADRLVDKRYQAISRIPPNSHLVNQQWEVRNRIEHSEPRFLMSIVTGEANSHSRIRCLAQSADRALFELQPITGRTHQLRLHMQSIGLPILNDNLYPTLLDERKEDYRSPLQLLSKRLRFTDPLSGDVRDFSCEHSLQL